MLVLADWRASEEVSLHIAPIFKGSANLSIDSTPLRSTSTSRICWQRRASEGRQFA